MSQVNQIKAILAVGFVLSIALMWNVERDSVRGRPAHTHTIQTTHTQSVQTSAQAQSAQPTRI
jgi:hypothetical protein